MKDITSIVLTLVWLCTPACSYLSFDAYCERFGKVYNAQEYIAHRDAFERAVSRFPEITDFTPGVNQFTDMLPGQIAST